VRKEHKEQQETLEPKVVEDLKERKEPKVLQDRQVLKETEDHRVVKAHREL
jgi:hypothetical protein